MKQVKRWKDARHNCQGCDDRDAECGAVQHSDQMQCDRCDLRWDVNDPHPPACAVRELRVGDTVGWEGDRWVIVGFAMRGGMTRVRVKVANGE